MTTYCQVVSHVLENLASVNITTEVKSKIDRFLKPSDMLPLEFVNELWLETIKAQKITSICSAKSLRRKTTAVHYTEFVLVLEELQDCYITKAGVSRHLSCLFFKQHCDMVIVEPFDNVDRDHSVEYAYLNYIKYQNFYSYCRTYTTILIRTRTKT